MARTIRQQYTNPKRVGETQGNTPPDGGVDPASGVTYGKTARMGAEEDASQPAQSTQSTAPTAPGGESRDRS